MQSGVGLINDGAVVNRVRSSGRYQMEDTGLVHPSDGISRPAH